MGAKFLALGLMSGTSLDGLDLALCSFSEKEDNYSYKILRAETISYDLNWRKKLLAAPQMGAEEFMELHHNYGKYLGQCAKEFLAEERIKPEIIASHGHTIFHNPAKGFSTQIGSGADIAATTGITTVCDFRDLDVALGGQGAPLVPIGDELLFSAYEACLNIGGISNVSFVKNGQRIAYDIAAANFVINYLAGKLKLKMDEDGIIARSGKTNEELFKALNADPYYFLDNKKSIGREWIQEFVIDKIERFKKVKTEDKISTFTDHAAFQIAETLRKNNLERVLVTGGGAYNKYLIKKIQNFCGAELILPEKNIIEFKEALIFAFLGYLRIKGKNNSLRTVTGARKNSCGGAVWG